MRILVPPASAPGRVAPRFGQQTPQNLSLQAAQAVAAGAIENPDDLDALKRLQAPLEQALKNATLEEAQAAAEYLRGIQTNRHYSLETRSALRSAYVACDSRIHDLQMQKSLDAFKRGNP